MSDDTSRPQQDPSSNNSKRDGRAAHGKSTSTNGGSAKRAGRRGPANTPHPPHGADAPVPPPGAHAGRKHKGLVDPANFKDISPVLSGWEYESGTINVRKIHGIDGLPKLQMRLDMGLLQMELDGRPDGRRPHGFESLLDYFETRLTEHRRRYGTELGFHLDGRQCQSLREEAVMYYHRYLSLFVLEDFTGVVRDTARNLRVLDLCGKYATDEQDRFVLEQYRPYITMMNARAQASISFKDKRYAEALAAVEEGMAKIKEFFDHFGQDEADEAYTRSSEVRVLKRFAKEIRRKIPVDLLNKLQKRLDRAVRDERYEEAARLRDRIANVKKRREAREAGNGGGGSQ